MSLIQALQVNDKKKLFTSNKDITFYSTGFDVLDYSNGTWAQLKDVFGNAIVEPMVGLQGGSLNSVIGTTGTGKSTLAVQVGWNIVRNFKGGLVVIHDCEKLLNPQRVSVITGTDLLTEDRILMNRTNTDIDSVLAMFNSICEVKENGKKEYQYEEERSITGKPYWAYQPTVMIIDSLPAFNSLDYNTETVGNQIDQMKATKDVTRFFTNILDRAWKYNVLFLTLNHVRPATITNQYTPPVPGVMMINPSIETLPRGQAAQYFTGTYLRIKTKKGDARTVEENGYDGYCSSASIAKSKTNVVGTTMPLVFNSAIGFDPVMTHYEFAHSVGALQGRNPYLYINGADEFKFKRQDFYNKFVGDKAFREAVLGALQPYYMALLGPKPETYQSESGLYVHKTSPVYNNITDLMDAVDAGKVDIEAA